MNARVAVVAAVTVAFALTATGCTGGSGDDAPTSGGSAPAGPAWLATGWHRSVENAGDFTSEVWNLNPDGTGTLRSATARPLIPYGAGDTESDLEIRWSATDTEMALLTSTPAPYFVTPNCRLLQLDDTVYERWGEKPCPFETPPLTAAESAIVGDWSVFVEGHGDWSASWARLYLSADRDVVLNYHASTFYTNEDTASFHARAYFTMDADGVFHGVAPDGIEQLKFTLTLTNGTLTLCDDGCFELTRM